MTDAETPREDAHHQRQILDSISDAYFLLDGSWRCLHANGVASKLLGIPVEEIEGQRLWDAVPELQGSGLAEHLKKSATNGVAVRFETYFPGRDAFAAAHCYPSGEGLALFLTDLTEARRNAHLLQSTEERFEALADIVPVLLFYSDASGGLEYANHRFASFSDVEPKDLLGDGWRALLHKDERADFEADWNIARREGTVLRRHCRLRNEVGEYRWFVLRARPMKDAEGEVSRWIGCFTDIHQEKNLEHELEEASQHKDEFISMLAHELRNPLAPIRSATRVLSVCGDGDARKDEMLQIIRRQIDQMARLLDDLLDVSRIAHGTILLDLEPIDLVSHARAVVADLTPVLTAASLRLRTSWSEQAIWVQADRARITQVIGNVVQNSAKFTPSGGHVEITLFADASGWAHLTIQDTGIGMDAKTQRYACEPFRQAQQPLDRTQGGLGLGLALARKLMGLHRGTLTVASEGRGEGTRVDIRLPYQPSPEDTESTVPGADRR